MSTTESFWDRLKRQVIDGYAVTTDKAEELTKIGHRKLDIATLRRKMGREMMALGGPEMAPAKCARHW